MRCCCFPACSRGRPCGHALAGECVPMRADCGNGSPAGAARCSSWNAEGPHSGGPCR
jgi:hypothetical protein